MNVESPSSHYDPETIVRMAEQGLTRESMMTANERKHWLAIRRIRRVYKRLRKERVGYVSLAEMATAAKADWRTVKEALKHSDEEVSLKLQEAFIVLSSRVAKDTYISSVKPLENARAVGHASKAERPFVSSKRTIAELQQKWFARGNMGDGLEMHAVYPPDSKKVKLRNQADAYAIAFMAEIAKEKLRKGDGASIKMTPGEAKAYLERKKSPSRFEETEIGLKRRLKAKKRGFPAKVALCTEKEPLARAPDIPSKPIDWAEVYRIDDEMRRKRGFKPH